MDHSLLNPNQLRAHGVEVQDNPFEPIQCHIDTGFDDIKIPLSIQGTVIFVNTRTPTEVELCECPHITLTSSKTWDPHNIKFPEPTTVIEDNQFVVKACKSNYSKRNDDIINTKMVSAAKVLGRNTRYFPCLQKNLLSPDSVILAST